MMLFADAALARRLEDAEARGTVEYAQAQARLRPEAGTAEVPVAGGYAVYAGLGSPLSRAVGLGLNGPIQAADLEQVEDFYHGRGAPAAVDLCPLADSSLRELLGRRGYRPAEFNNVWVRPVNEAESWPAPPPGISVAVAGPAEAELWARTVTLGFSSQEEVPSEEQEIAAPFFYMSTAVCFLAQVEGGPAGGAAMAIHQGLAALFSTSTLPAFRERGVQTSLLRARLAFAARAGCDLATVQTEPGSASQRNVERLGFRLAYTKLTMICE